MRRSALDGLRRRADERAAAARRARRRQAQREDPGADGSLTVRALHVKVIQGNGTPLVDLVVARDQGRLQRPGLRPRRSRTAAATSGPGLPDRLDATTRVERLRHQGRRRPAPSLGDVIVGPPVLRARAAAPSCRSTIARKKYGTSPCLSGNGAPKFAIVGTNKADRITGTNVADRIIGLGGNDKLDGGRGNDCIEGRTGGDTMSGGLGNDKVYGSTGNDHLNGGPGTDYLSGGAGNDTISAGLRPRPRRSAAPASTSSTSRPPVPRPRADCGSGADKIRLNRNETKKHQALRDGRTSSRTSRPAALADGARAGLATVPPVSRRDQIRMTRRRGRRVPRRGAHRRLRDDRQRRLPAPHAALVRRARRRAVGVDVREVAEGAQPRARPARDAAGRGRRASTTSCAA